MESEVGPSYTSGTFSTSCRAVMMSMSLPGAGLGGLDPLCCKGKIRALSKTFISLISCNEGKQEAISKISPSQMQLEKTGFDHSS